MSPNWKKLGASLILGFIFSASFMVVAIAKSPIRHNNTSTIIIGLITLMYYSFPPFVMLIPLRWPIKSSHILKGFFSGLLFIAILGGFIGYANNYIFGTFLVSFPLNLLEAWMLLWGYLMAYSLYLAMRAEREPKQI